MNGRSANIQIKKQNEESEQESSEHSSKENETDVNEMNGYYSKERDQCPDGEEECTPVEEVCLQEGQDEATCRALTPFSSLPRVKRQILDDCWNPCIIYLSSWGISINLCIIIISVLPIATILMMNRDPEIPIRDIPEMPDPPQIFFHLPPPPPAPIPLPTSAPTPLPTRAPTPLPTRAPTPLPTPTPTIPLPTPVPTPVPPPTPAPTPLPTPAPTPLPLPLLPVEVRTRILVPYCNGTGYLSLVERLKRLITGNTGRPLSPMATSLAGAVNYCKYGMGTSSGTVGLVPEAPQQMEAPTVASIFLRDQEANMTLQTPQRWPGISLPALYLYQDQRQPPPLPPPPSTNITIITTTITTNGTIISNTTQVIPETPGAESIPANLPPGGMPGTATEGTTGTTTDGTMTDSILDTTTDGTMTDGTPDTTTDSTTSDNTTGTTAGDSAPGSSRPPPEEVGPIPVTASNLGSRKAFSCGGALISPYHVLTAAHCLLAPGLSNTARFQKPSVVRLGEVDFKRADESQAFDYRVSGVQIHEGYALPAKYNDIAIITLKDRVEFTSALRPYCLPQRPAQLVGRRCSVAGWGRRPGGLASTVLHNIEVEVVSSEECQSAYANDPVTSPFFNIDYPEGVTANVLCAGGINNVCRGDSGGPLVLSEGGVEEEIGVVSTGYGCGALTFPGIYTRVDQFTPWIEREIYGQCAAVAG